MAKRAQSSYPQKPQSKPKAEEHWWKTPTVIAAVIAALAAISVALINQRTAPKSQPLEGDLLRAGSWEMAAFNAAEIKRLSEQLGVTKVAVNNFLHILREQQVPVEELDAKLREIAARHNVLQAELTSFRSTDPTVIAKKMEAAEALSQGKYERVEELLREAEEFDLAAVMQVQATADQRLLSAAESRAQRAMLKLNQLRYDNATELFLQAADLAPVTASSVRAEYLARAATAFDRTAESYVKSIRSTAEIMGSAAEAFERGLRALTDAGIGVNYEEAPASGGLKITGVGLDMPAGQAGIAEGDLLVAIDGATTAGITLKEANARLRGPVASAVSVTLLRDGHRRELELARAPFFKVDLSRREELTHVMVALRNLADAYRQEAIMEADTVAAEAVEHSKLPAAFYRLVASMARRQAMLPDVRARTTVLVQQALAVKPRAVELFQRTVDLIGIMEDGHVDFEIVKRIAAALDEEVAEFKLRASVNDFDQNLLSLSINIVNTLSFLRTDLAGQLKTVRILWVPVQY